jgi:hypothetical protein
LAEKRISPAEQAIAVMEQRKKEIRENYERDLAEIARIIDVLKNDPPKQEGRMAGMSLPDAIHAYLLMHRGPVKFTKIVEGLKQGGVDLGKTEKPNRFAANVRTTITNNIKRGKRFLVNEAKDTVKLRTA